MRVTCSMHVTLWPEQEDRNVDWDAYRRRTARPGSLPPEPEAKTKPKPRPVTPEPEASAVG